MPATTGWRSFISWSTLFSSALFVLFWSLQWSWSSGLLVVLLLYIHEAGHVFAARRRRVPIQRAPVFIPGLGAFVLTNPGTRPWDRFWVALGGPLLGTPFAFAARWAGLWWGLPDLAFAGEIMLLVNLMNLAPFSPLDGGQMVLATGWLGFVPAALLAGVVLPQGLGLLVTTILLLGLVMGTVMVQRSRPPGWGSRFAMLGLYLAALAGVALLFARTTPHAPWPPGAPRPGLPDIYQVATFSFFALLASIVAGLLAFAPRTGPRRRYLTAALTGWPQYLLTYPPLSLYTGCLAAHLLGLPGLAWLRRLLRTASAAGSLLTGSGAAFAYDCLVRQGQGEAAAAWLTEATPLVRAAGLGAVADFYGRMAVLGHPQAADRWLLAPDWDDLPEDAPPVLLNNLAWALLRQGRPAAALPFARRAVAAQPENPAHVDTLGEVLVAVGEPVAAEPYLRQVLKTVNLSVTRLALAQALAAQGRYPEAAAEGERALRQRRGGTGVWDGDLATARAAVARWRAAAAAAPATAGPGRARRFVAALGRATPTLAVLVALGTGLVYGALARRQTAAVAPLPRQVAGEAASFYGDEGVSEPELEQYRHFFEQRLLPEIARDTGLKPGTRDLAFAFFATEAAWRAHTGNSSAAARTDPDSGRLQIALWRIPADLRSGLVTEVYIDWLHAGLGPNRLPAWFSTGISVDEASRVVERAADWETQYIQGQWQRLTTTARDEPVPRLALHPGNSVFARTAVAHLLASRGRPALLDFYRHLGAGRSFDEAFAEAFGLTPATYQGEFEQVVARRRGG